MLGRRRLVELDLFLTLCLIFLCCKAIARATRAEITDVTVRKRTEVVEYLTYRCKQSVAYLPVAKALLESENLKLVMGTPEGPLPMLPSASYIRENVNAIRAKRLDYQERLLASVEPRDDGIIAIDLQHRDSR